MHGKPVRALGQGFARLADWLGRMLVVCGAFYLVQAVLLGLAWLDPPDITPQGGVAAHRPTRPRPGAGAAASLVMLGVALVFLLVQVTWLVWQYQLAAAAPVRLRRSPAGHVGWWFVPIASWFVPRGNIGDLWRAYGRQRRGERVGTDARGLLDLVGTLDLADRVRAAGRLAALRSARMQDDLGA